MRVLYVASAIEAGGSSGGWTHVTEVACGLRDLGHTVRVIARAPSGNGLEGRGLVDCPVPLTTTRIPRFAAISAYPLVARTARAMRADVIMERFYNFAGAGVLYAHRHRKPAVLEVNAPMTDPAGSAKSRVDRLLFGSMRRWAVTQARWSRAVITPLASTVPPEVNRAKIHELPWGANVERFDPQIRERDSGKLKQLQAELGLRSGVPAAVFLGSFRAWHGVGHFAEAARTLLANESEVAFFAVGGGPELVGLQQTAAGWKLPAGRLVFAGPQAHSRVPELLALASIGVAPFDLAAHAPLTEFGFYWSPLKVFEYMAMALPVVTIDVPPLNSIVRHEQEGLLYRPGDVSGLAQAIGRLAGDPELRARLGAQARQRVVEKYSWRAHCEALDLILKDAARGHG